MPKQGLAPHESVELHEILTFKSICLTKSVTMSPLVSDNELKIILQQDAETTEKHIKELRNLIGEASTTNNISQDTSALS